MSEINYEISASMQNRFAVHRENRLKPFIRSATHQDRLFPPAVFRRA